MKKYNNIMVGLNSNNEIVCIDYVELRDREERNEFSVVFSGWSIKCPDDESEVIEQYVEDLLDNIDIEYKYNRCEYYDCSPRELYQNIVDDTNIYDVYDTNSKYDDEIYYTTDCDTKFPVYLNFSFSTPQDYKPNYSYGEIIRFINADAKRLFDKVNEIGKQYHLKNIPTDVWDELETEVEKYLSNKDLFAKEVRFVEGIVKEMEECEC